MLKNIVDAGREVSKLTALDPRMVERVLVAMINEVPSIYWEMKAKVLSEYAIEVLVKQKITKVIQDLPQDRCRVPAIKEYRLLSGASLQEAIIYVDTIILSLSS